MCWPLDNIIIVVGVIVPAVVGVGIGIGTVPAVGVAVDGVVVM